MAKVQIEGNRTDRNKYRSQRIATSLKLLIDGVTRGGDAACCVMGCDVSLLFVR